MRYRVIRDGETINQVEWDRNTGWQPPEGCTLEPIEDAPVTEPDPDEIEATRLMHAAMALLGQTDFVVIKATEKGRTLSQDWLAWRDELRAIVSTRAGVIRAEPERYGPAPEPEAPLLPAPDALMREWGTVGDEEAEAAITTDDLLAADDEAQTDVIGKLSRQRRKRFTELLNVELAELEQSRGGPKEDRKREAKIQRLLGVFARVGEM